MGPHSNPPGRSGVRIQTRPERRVIPELAAYRWVGSSFQQESVRNISSTGVYLRTDQRCEPGSLVSLTLQRKGPPEKDVERRIAIKARAVRQGHDGVGLSFVLPLGMALHLWESPLKSFSEQTEPEDILWEFRLASAISFLCRISPHAAAEIRQLLREGLSNYRIKSAIEIALRAEELLSFAAEEGRWQAPARLVVRILQDGSWADSETVQQLWAGLLATSCTAEGNDESNLTYVQLLSQLTPAHIGLLAAACTRSTKILTTAGRISSRPVACTSQELMRVTGSRDILRIDRDIEHLSDLGLLLRRAKSSFFSAADDAKISPTSLGLLLFARCNGYRGTPQDFYGVSTADTPAFAAEI
ncbi:MAG TPA: PilZ domain-containing protein [Terracidiphilus sp.]|nr:PilZ domain-containing protein [Terracidiphilus sp.]